MTLSALLDSCGIATHPSEQSGYLACVCPACGKGAADLTDFGGSEVWLYCPRCAANNGRRFTFGEFRAEFGGERTAPENTLAYWTFADFLAREDLPLPGAVVEGLLLEGTVSFWFGPAGSGKSASAADLARCKAAGWRFLGRFPCDSGPAVLIEQESAPALLRQRLAELEAAEALPDDAATLTIIPLQGLRLDDEASRLALRELLRGLAPKLIVCDTLAALAGGTDLLDVRHVRPLMDFFREIATELSAAVLLLAHTPKWAGKEPTLAALYGSEDLGAACDSAFALCKLPTSGSTFRVAQVKNRWGADLADFTFTMEPGPEGGLVLTGGESSQAGIEDLLLDALDGGDWTPNRELTETGACAGFSADGVRKALKRLRNDGKVEAQGSTTTREYRLAQEASL